MRLYAKKCKAFLAHKISQRFCCAASVSINRFLKGLLPRRVLYFLVLFHPRFSRRKRQFYCRSMFLSQARFIFFSSFPSALFPQKKAVLLLFYVPVPSAFYIF